MPPPPRVTEKKGQAIEAVTVPLDVVSEQAEEGKGTHRPEHNGYGSHRRAELS